MSDKTVFIINTLSEIWYDLRYLRDKVVIDPEIKEELTDRMIFIDDVCNNIRDGHIKVNEEGYNGIYEIRRNLSYPSGQEV